jgi:uncharacterized protein
MALDKELLDLLACPKCKGSIRLLADETAFVCDACRLSYAITDEIPNFIVEEAKPLSG